VRILIVSDVSPIAVLGGAERVVWEQASRLAAAGHRVRVVSRAPRHGGEGAVVYRDVPVRHFAVDRRTLRGFLRTSILGARRAVAEEVDAHGADVLHFHQPLAAFGALTSPVGRRLPSLYTFHSPAPLEYRTRRGTTDRHRGGLAGYAGAAALWLFERASLSRATRIHVLSDFSASLVGKLYRIPRARIVKIPAGVDLDRFQPPRDRVALRRELGLPAGRPLLFTLRNLEPRMGLDNLLRAMNLLRRLVPDTLLLIGGAGSLRRELEALAASLRLEDHVKFLGFVADADLPRYYGAADAFVLPTRALEGFGLVTVEALACGTPVLGTPVGATPEILVPLAPALVFRGVSAEAMAQDLGRFLHSVVQDPAGARRLRDASRRHAETRYGWERSIGDLETTLQTLAERPEAAAPPRACSVCGTQATPRLVRHGQPYEVCPGCGTAARRARPGAAELRAFYERDYPARFAPDRIGRPRVELFTALLARLGSVEAGRRLLDLGCGGGQLMVAAAKLGWRSVGSDVAYEACAVARTVSGGPVIQADSAEIPLRDRSVEAVTLINVLDHLPDPARVLAEARRVLTPGGALVIRVPNGAFHRPSLRVLGWVGPLARRFRLNVYPVLHLFSFTARGLRCLVERAGFRVLVVRNSSLTAEGPAWADAEPGELPGWLRAGLAAGVRVVETLSGRRWLLAPSIELYACRREGDARP
jgi:glycosyltransferase involved in cell wall biosynthesis/ubiquinone/menaquinone biosynthesis C-methylase UbiE